MILERQGVGRSSAWPPVVQHMVVGFAVVCGRTTLAQFDVLELPSCCVLRQLQCTVHSSQVPRGRVAHRPTNEDTRSPPSWSGVMTFHAETNPERNAASSEVFDKI